MLQALGRDSLPVLGAALLQLERGDTTAGVAALEKLAGSLGNSRGASEVRLYAGAAARAAGHPQDAERLYRGALEPADAPAAPAAALALGRLLLETDRAGAAVEILEQMILSHPESALLPQARRTLDQARGAVPRT
jgi:predicted Zn-dependent protease